jgi:hypothetical protein
MACFSALASLQGFISMDKTGKGKDGDNSIVVRLLVCILIRKGEQATAERRGRVYIPPIAERLRWMGHPIFEAGSADVL